MTLHRSLTAFLVALVLAILPPAGAIAKEMPAAREAPTGDATRVE